MRKLIILVTILFGFSLGFTQETIEKKKPTEADKVANFDERGFIKRGAPIGDAKKVSLGELIKKPEKYSNQTVLVEGLIVRSCKKEGCWAELAPIQRGKSQSVRVKMKDHAFFIPLQSEGLLAKVQGRVIVKVLSKEQVKHMIEEDGARFEKINPDGTVTEITFEADGIELRKPDANTTKRRSRKNS
ncbi:MAG: DUF4920 domain-containing protein [Pyrinomonadaceae bacterium]|nr:DUF4920 domain-containing protein [Pyrinomonadaceae bacterium]MCX7639573.1 DUF4920 domain-containing protein [Pyrinomonadaceae bacterium]MDW8303966.1 DUF4920 domain-containing protein [Acidobacteriota bacterium]